MKKVIGICGHQGSGKSTLCKSVEENFKEIKFFQTTISETLKNRGITALGNHKDFNEFLDSQLILAQALARQLLDLPQETYVVDRTFYDMYVYTIAQINESSATEIESKILVKTKLELFLDLLIAFQESLFNTTFFIDQVVVYPIAEGSKLRGSSNLHYLNNLVLIQRNLIEQRFSKNPKFSFVCLNNINSSNTAESQLFKALENIL